MIAVSQVFAITRESRVSRAFDIYIYIYICIYRNIYIYRERDI